MFNKTSFIDPHPRRLHMYLFHWWQVLLLLLLTMMLMILSWCWWCCRIWIWWRRCCWRCDSFLPYDDGLTSLLNLWPKIVRQQIFLPLCFYTHIWMCNSIFTDFAEYIRWYFCYIDITMCRTIVFIVMRANIRCISIYVFTSNNIILGSTSLYQT